MSSLLHLNLGDFWRGAVVAVLAVIFTYLAGVMNAPGFEFSSLNVQEILKMAITAFVAYMSKNLLTDSSGKILGVK